MWRSVVGFSALVAASTAPDGYPSRANVFDLNNLLRQHTEFSANSKFKWTTNLPKNLKNDVIFGNNIIGEVHAGLTESSDDSDEHGHEVKSEKFVLTPSSQVQLLDNEIYIPGDTYTRLVVCSYFSNHDECFQSARDGDRGKNDKLEIYPYKKRSPIERLFIGKRHNQNLSVSVRAGEFVATIPLVNISHTSTKVDGEIFSPCLSG